MKTTILKFALLFICLFTTCENIFSCSMYKITLNGKTIVGTNFDAYYTTPNVWFEIGTETGKIGVAFSGGRQDGANGIAPQSGMNEAGLAFSRLASATPKRSENAVLGKNEITNPTQYLKAILHNCKNIEEVQAYISNFDHSFFTEDVFIYIEKSGKYLVVEPYTMTVGNDANYVLSNFCPSVTDEASALKITRYRNGVNFLKNNIDTSLQFCKMLSDTMHVCRKKIGDGTLLSSNWDLKNGIFNLYFYHDYKNTVQFNVKDELAKGNHSLEITTLFPQNAEFERLKNYRIPQNTPLLMQFLIFSMCFFFFSFVYFLFSYFKSKKEDKSYTKLIFSILNIIIFYYMFVLGRTMYVFYFPAPYKDYKFSMLNIAAYIPFLILMSIGILLVFNRKIWKENTWHLFSKILFTANNILYLVWIGLFAYWDLFDVFG